MSVSPRRRVVLMGVSGAGKTAIGTALAERLGWTFLDADSLHPAANIAKMTVGEALSENDRRPWLEAVSREVALHNEIVVACSALKRSYRDQLRRRAPDAFFVHLSATEPELTRRMQARDGHFMPVSLLRSQLATLEPLDHDETGAVVATDREIDATVTVIMARLALGAWETAGSL